MFEEMFSQLQDITPTLMIFLGLAIGVEHSFEADHLAAVTTRVAKLTSEKSTKRSQIKANVAKSSLLGVFWGAGHTTTLVLMGLVVYSLTITIQDQIFAGFELAIGIMLILLAFTTITNKRILKFKHKHPHQHKDNSIHFESHTHTDDSHFHSHKSYLIGLLHGLAGSGILVVLAANTMNSFETVLSFMLILGAGSIIGMALTSGVMGFPFVLSSKIKHTQKVTRFLAGGFSILIGSSMIFEIVSTGKFLGT